MEHPWRDWCEYVLKPVLRGEAPEDGAVQRYGGLALLAADTDRTQDYVFESAKLPEIRGASRQITDLTAGIERRVTDLVCPEALLFAGGGGALALLPDDRRLLEGLADDIRADYLDTTGAATITCDWRPVRVSDVLEGYPKDTSARFGALVDWAGTWLRRSKEDRPPGPFYEALPYAVRCQSCRVRPAAPSTSFPDWALCPVCRAKRDYAERYAWFREYQERLCGDRCLHKAYYGEGSEGFPSIEQDAHADIPRWLPQDLSELGQASQRQGYVGTIYLDGDDMGSILGQLPTAGAYHRLSKAIERAMGQAVMAALADKLCPKTVRASPARQQVGEQTAPGTPVKIHPFEILTIGGDDVVLIVPADAALPIAAAISIAFTAQMRQEWQAILQELPTECRPPLHDKAFTMSGGVVIADDHNPVRILYDLAVELKGIAKRARRDAEADIGYVDFQILKSADMLERQVSKVRKIYPYQIEDPDEGALRLWMRPYPAPTVRQLGKELPGLKLSRTQMHRLLEALLRGRREGTLFYLYQKARREQVRALHEWMTRVWPANDHHDPLPWYGTPDRVRRTGVRYWTPLWDLGELYEFVAEEEAGDD